MGGLLLLVFFAFMREGVRNTKTRIILSLACLTVLAGCSNRTPICSGNVYSVVYNNYIEAKVHQFSERELEIIEDNLDKFEPGSKSLATEESYYDILLYDENGKPIEQYYADRFANLYNEKKEEIKNEAIVDILADAVGLQGNVATSGRIEGNSTQYDFSNSELLRLNKLTENLRTGSEKQDFTVKYQVSLYNKNNDRILLFRIDSEFHVYNSEGFQVFSDDLESMFRLAINKSR